MNDARQFIDANPAGMGPEQLGARHIPVYYEKLGLHHDAILRCKDCKKLVLHADIKLRAGCSHCGCRRLVEVTTLGVFEWLKMKLGVLDFPYRAEFLAEFSRGTRAPR